MNHLTLLVDLKRPLEILDKLNTSGKCLFIQEDKIIDFAIKLFNSYEYSDLSLYDKTEVLINMLNLDDYFIDEHGTNEILKSNLYTVLYDLYKILFIFKMLDSNISVNYVNRLNKNDVLFRVIKL